MNCPLIIYPSGTLGTTDYYAPCECIGICELAKCKYRKNGFLIKVQALGDTEANAVAILGKKCGSSMPLVAASDNAPLTNAELTAGDVYTVIPATVDGILYGVVQGL